MGKRYYWLKLKRDFFKRHDIQIIEGMPNGKDYILFYLKLLVESIDHEGQLRFNDTIPYSEQMLSTITNTNIDIVRNAMKIFTELHLVEILENQTIYMNEIKKMIGSESYWAERKRVQRGRESEREKIGQCPNDVQLLSSMSKQELDKEIDIDKEVVEVVVEVVEVVEENTATAISKIKQVYEDNIGLITQTVIEDINSFLDDGIEDELITEAIKEAVFNNVRNWSYARKIISDCLVNNIKTKEQFEARKIERQTKQKKPNGRDKPSYKNYPQRDYSQYENMFENV